MPSSSSPASIATTTTAKSSGDDDDDDVDFHWKNATNPGSGRAYYYHELTEETRWEKPKGYTESTKKETITTKSSGDDDDDDVDFHWKNSTDPGSGRTYYYHELTEVTQWEKPRGYKENMKNETTTIKSSSASPISNKGSTKKAPFYWFDDDGENSAKGSNDIPTKAVVGTQEEQYVFHEDNMTTNTGPVQLTSVLMTTTSDATPAPTFSHNPGKRKVLRLQRQHFWVHSKVTLLSYR